MLAQVATALAWLLPAPWHSRPIQDSSVPSAPVEARSSEWILLDRVSVTVNEKAVTERELWSMVMAQRTEISTDQEAQAALSSALRDRVERLLKVQAGKDLGFDPEIVERNVQFVLEDHRERLGTDRLSDWLKVRHLDSAAYRAEATEEVYASAWERSVTGRDAGPSGRPNRDRYVRPGQILYAYRKNRDILGEPARVVLQQLIVSTSTAGGEELARELAEELRARALSGEDFGMLAEDHGNTEPGSRGITKPMSEQSLIERFPVLGDFLTGAAPGDISKVLPFERDGSIVGFIVVKLLDRLAPEEVEFEAPSRQKELSEQILSERDRYWLASGLTELLQASYVWPKDVFVPSTKP